MYLCDDQHEQIVYDGGACPLCDLLDVVSDLEAEKENLEAELRDLDEQLEEERQRYLDE